MNKSREISQIGGKSVRQPLLSEEPMAPTKQDLLAMLGWLDSEQRSNAIASAARRLVELTIEDLDQQRAPGHYKRAELLVQVRSREPAKPSEQAKNELPTKALRSFFNGNRRQIQAWMAATQHRECLPLVLCDAQPGQGAGRERLFWLERADDTAEVSLPAELTDEHPPASVPQFQNAVRRPVVTYGMTYCAASDLTRWGRFIFRDGRLRRGDWRWKLLATRVILSLSVPGLAVLLTMVLAMTTKPVDLMLKLAIEAAIVGAFVVVKARAWHRTVEDRIRNAPDELVEGIEPAQLEIVGSGPQSEWRLVRYAASCPVCAGEIRVLPGEPDFPRRLVGRCAQSPREHVFSFDRITLLGAPLIVPPII